MLTTPNYIWGIILICTSVVLAFFAWYSGRQETRLKSLKSAMQSSQCTWAFWYTGQQAIDDNVIRMGEPTSLKKLMLLKPNLKNPSYAYNIKLAGEDTPALRQKNIAYVNELIERAKSANPKTDIYYHFERLTYSFTIFDTTPEQKRGKLYPNSKNAWVVMQPIEPKRAGERKDWHKWVVKNRGNSKEKFKAYYQLFCDIEKRAKLIS